MVLNGSVWGILCAVTPSPRLPTTEPFGRSKGLAVPGTPVLHAASDAAWRPGDVQHGYEVVRQGAWDQGKIDGNITS